MIAYDVCNFQQDAESNLSIAADLFPESSAAVVVAYYAFESVANAIVAAVVVANSSAAAVVALHASTVDSAD